MHFEDVTGGKSNQFLGVAQMFTILKEDFPSTAFTMTTMKSTNFGNLS